MDRKMDKQYKTTQCDVCHQPLHQDDRLISANCQHKYHRKCLPRNDETSHLKCPICLNEKQKIDSLKTTTVLSRPTTNESMAFNNSSQSWSCNGCKSNNSRNSTQCKMCATPRVTDFGNEYQEVMRSEDSYGTSKNPSELVSDYTTDSSNDTLKIISSLLKGKPMSDQLLQQQDRFSLEWKCEKCALQNKSNVEYCSMCGEAKRPYAVPEMVTKRTSQQPSRFDKPKLEERLYPLLSEKNSTTETTTTVSSSENKSSMLSSVRSLSEQKFIVFIPDLPFHSPNKQLEEMIHLHLSKNHRIHVAKIVCYSTISVGIVYVGGEADKNYLVKNLQSIVLDPQTNTIIKFVEEFELISYLVLDQNNKMPSTTDDVARRWQQLCKLSQLPTCEVVTIQFPNIFRIVSRSLNELFATQNIDLIAIKNQFIQIYFNANCSFFQDLPQDVSASQITVAINAQIGGEFDQSSLYVQYNKDTSTAIVLATNAARQWSHINCIILNNQYCMKKNCLNFRLVIHSFPHEIPIDIITQHKQLRNAVTQSTRIGDKLIIEVKGKSTYDTCVTTGAICIKDHSVRIEPYTTIITNPENMEINAETWYATQMLEYNPDIKQFLDNPQHPIFKYKWNTQSWLEQFQNHAGKRNDEHDKQRRLLRVTVMLNTIGVLLQKYYSIEINNNKKEIKLNVPRMKNIIYNHRSKLFNTKEILRSLSTPFPSTTVKVVNEDCLVVYERLALEQKRPLLLNMANAFTPGGGYRKGAGAQEENIFRRSNYYLSLDMELDYNKQADRFCCTANCDQKPIDTNQKMYPIDEYGAIYTSGITVFRDTEDKGYAYLEQPVYGVCSIALAAYARPKLKRNMLTEKYAVNTRKKIENLFAIAYHHGHDCLVLSAFGCGAFGNPPNHIAMIFKSVIEQYAGYFQTIYFSIIDDHNTGNQINPDGNYRPFKTILNDKIVQPSNCELDMNMMSGPFRVINKNQDRIIIDHVKILDRPPCKFGSLCHDLNNTQHCQSYSHPPLCPCYESCDQSLNDEVHLRSFIHRSKCLHGGVCKDIEDEKHLRLYEHPEFCLDHGFCRNMDKNHLIKFRHVQLCKDGLKCPKNTPDHCRSYRHCQVDCSSKDDQKQEGRSLWNVVKDKVFGKDDKSLIPCRDSVNCLLQYSSEESKSHNKKYSHPCRYSELCRSISDHPHLEHNPHSVPLCSHDKNCRDLVAPVHRAQYRHTNLPDFLYPCQYQRHCKIKSIEHRIKYSHGEQIPLSLVAVASVDTSSLSTQLQTYENNPSEYTKTKL